MAPRSQHQKSDRIASHIESNRALFSSALNLAITMTPGYQKRIGAGRKAGAAPLLSDDETLALMRRVIIGGEPAARICREKNISQDTFGKWVQGINRVHLRAQIDREIRTAKP